MSISIPHQITQDWRILASQDQAVNRKIQIRNLQREAIEAGPKWKAAQQNLYGNLTDITPDITLGQVISGETELAGNNSNNRALVLQDLIEISDAQVAQYIIDRLNPNEIRYLAVNFKEILLDLRKKNSRMDKNIFVNIVKKASAENPVNVEEQPLSAEAQERQSQETEQASAYDQGLNEKEEASVRQMEAQQEIANEYNRREAVRRAKQETKANAYNQETPDLNSLFGNGEEDIADELELIRLQAKARSLKAQQDGELALRADDSPPVKIGPERPNPSTPPTISPEMKSGSSGGGGKKKKESSTKKEPTESAKKKKREEKVQKNLKIDMNMESKGRGIIYGRGTTMRPATAKKRFYFGKYYVELDKLANNILSVKYAKTDAYIPTLSVQHISNKVREVIQDVMKEEYNERIFKLLPDDDKRVFKRFVKALKLGLPTYDDLDAQFQREYEILLGEFNSGNDSPEIKKALKKYVVEVLNEGILNRHQAYFLLYQLSL